MKTKIRKTSRLILDYFMSKKKKKKIVNTEYKRKTDAI